MTHTTGLRYIPGSGFVPGVPARDLSVAEVRAFGGRRALRLSGCYAPDDPTETETTDDPAAPDATPDDAAPAEQKGA